MGVVVEEIKFTEDTSGLARAAHALEQLQRDIGGIGVAGAKVGTAMQFNELPGQISKATGELKTMEAIFAKLNKAKVVDVEQALGLRSGIAAKREQIKGFMGTAASGGGPDVAEAQGKVQAYHDYAASVSKVKAAVVALHAEEGSQAAAKALFDEEVAATKLDKAYEKQLADIKKLDAEKGKAAKVVGSGKASGAANDNGGMNSAALSELDGALGGTIGKMKELGTAGGAAAAGVAAVVAMVAGAVAVLGAFAGIVASIAKASMDASDSKQALVGRLSATEGSETKAREVADSIDELSKQVPVAAERLEEYARSLSVAGIHGDRLTATMAALARVEGVAGADAASKLQGLIEKMSAEGHALDPAVKALAGTGVTLDAYHKALADKLGVGQAQVAALLKSGKVTVEQGIDAMNAAIDAKFGKSGAEAMLRFDVQLAKLHEGFSMLLEDVDWKPVQKALQSVLSVFDESTASGKMLKDLAQDIFATLSASATRAAPYIKAFLEGFIEGLRDAWEGVKPVLSALESLLGISADASGAEKWREYGKVFVQLLAGVVGFAEGIMGAVAAFGLLIAAFTAPLWAPIMAAVWAVGKLVDMVQAAVAAFNNLGSAVGSIGGGIAGVGNPIAAGIISNGIGGGGGGGAPANDVVGSAPAARGAGGTTNQITVNAAPAVVHVPADATPADAKKLGAAAAAGAHEENERLMVATFRRLGMTG